MAVKVLMRKEEDQGQVQLVGDMRVGTGVRLEFEGAWSWSWGCRANIQKYRQTGTERHRLTDPPKGRNAGAR